MPILSGSTVVPKYSPVLSLLIDPCSLLIADMIMNSDARIPFTL